METTKKIYVIANKEYAATTLEEAKAMHKKTKTSKSAQDLYNECGNKVREMIEWLGKVEDNPTATTKEMRYGRVVEEEIKTIGEDGDLVIFYPYTNSRDEKVIYTSNTWIQRDNTQRRIKHSYNTRFMYNVNNEDRTEELKNLSDGFRIIWVDTKEEYIEWLNNFDAHFEKFKKFINTLIENNKLYIPQYEKEKEQELIEELKERKESITETYNLIKEYNI